MDSIFFINYLLRIFTFSIILNKYLSIDIDINYPHSLSLLNGNVFIIHNKGVKVYNYNFTIPLYDYNFGGIILISNDVINDLTFVIQCDDDNNQYVLTLIYNIIYVFSSRGQFLFKLENFYDNFLDLSNLSSNKTFSKHYSFLYYKNENQLYEFIIIFINDAKEMIALKLGINMNTQSIKFINEKVLKENIETNTCQLSTSNNITNILICFIQKVNNLNLVVTLFDIENDFHQMNESSIPGTELIKESLLKSTFGKNNEKILICFSSKQIAGLFYDINSHESNLIYGPTCDFLTKTISVDYLKYSNQYIFSCKNSMGVSLEIFPSNKQNPQDHAIFSQGNFDCIDFSYYFIISLPFDKKCKFLSNSFCNEASTKIYDFPDGILGEIDLGSNEPDSFFINSSSIPPISPQMSYSTIPITINNNIYTTIISTLFQNIQTTTPLNVQKTTILTSLPNEIVSSISTTILYTIQTNIPSTLYSIFPTTTIKSGDATFIVTTDLQIETTILKAYSSIPSTIENEINKRETHSSLINISPSTFSSFLSISTSEINEKKMCQIKCFECNEESSFLNLCIKCNEKIGYYPSIIIGYDFVECYNNETKPINYFLIRKRYIMSHALLIVKHVIIKEMKK